MDLKPYNVKAVLMNIENAFKHNSIEKLNNTGYHFLYLMSGFIAHYNLSGFQGHYADLRKLLANIKRAVPIEKDCAVRDINDPRHNGYGLPYCQSKLEIIDGLKIITEKYEKQVLENGKTKDADKWELLKKCVERAKTDKNFRSELLDKVFT